MKQLSKFLIVSSYSLLLGAGSVLAEDIPPSQLAPETGVNRKPAVMPRVYIDADQVEQSSAADQDSPEAAAAAAVAADGVDFFYYDYKEQKAQGEQSPPLRLSQINSILTSEEPSDSDSSN